MNKLLLLCFLSIMIFYVQCTDCKDAPIKAEDNPDATTKANYCKGLDVKSKSNECVPSSDGSKCEEKALPCPTPFTDGVSTDDDKKKFCEGLSVAANKICQLKSDKSACVLADKPATNSGSILNAFQITFALIIIFTIL